MEPWLIVLGVGIVASLVGVIYWAGQSRDDKQDARAERNERALADHVRDDIEAHERLRALETKVESHDREIAGIRERWHDLRSEISTTLGNWYTTLANQINRRDR